MNPLLKGGVGRDASYDLEFVDGQLVFSLNYDGDGVDGRLSVKLDPAYFIDQLSKAIPGQIDDAVFAMIKAALLNK